MSANHRPTPWGITTNGTIYDANDVVLVDQVHPGLAAESRVLTIKARRLMVAAPDLLDACRLAFTVISKSGGNPYLTEPGRTIAAAIAKAEGKQ
jgi:hypothetical protein